MAIKLTFTKRSNGDHTVELLFAGIGKKLKIGKIRPGGPGLVYIAPSGDVLGQARTLKEVKREAERYVYERCKLLSGAYSDPE